MAMAFMDFYFTEIISHFQMIYMYSTFFYQIQAADENSKNNEQILIEYREILQK